MCIVEDLREEFARDFVFPIFQAGAVYEGQCFLGAGIVQGQHNRGRLEKSNQPLPSEHCLDGRYKIALQSIGRDRLYPAGRAAIEIAGFA